MRMPNSDKSRECYMGAGLLVAIAGLSHSLGYWPYTRQSSARVDGSVVSVPSFGDFTMLNGDVIWRLLFMLTLITVGVLYYQVPKACHPINVAHDSQAPL